MSDWPKLNKSEIYKWMSDDSFSLNHHLIINPSRTGYTLQALYQGEMREFYRIKIMLDKEKIVAASCSCPVGYGGGCQHAAALLFVWLEDPDRFIEVGSLQAALEKHNDAQLIVRLRQMMARYPDLETLFEIPLPGTGQQVSAESIRRQVTLAMSGYDRAKWRASATVARQLEHLLNMAGEYSKSQEWQNASTIYEVLAREVLAQYHTFDDEEGDFLGIVNESVEGLAACLTAVDTSYAALRLTIWRTLFDIYCWDVKSGGTEMGYDAPNIILAHSTLIEKEQIVRWTEEAIAASKDGEWSQRTLGRFALALQKETLDDETFLRICREQGFYQALVNRLLCLGRVKDAEEEARQMADHELVSLAELFVHYDQTPLIEQLFYERVPQSKNSTLLRWLKQHAEKEGNVIKALQIAERLFWLLRTFSSYQEVKELAQKVGRWEQLHAELITRLTQDKQFGLLTEIHLSENEVDLALVALSKVSGGFQWWGGDLSMEVARTVEKIRPHAAISLYLSKVNSLIKARGRENYASAASYLKRIRKLYVELNEMAKWQILINYIRQEHRHTFPLMDELNQARL